MKEPLKLITWNCNGKFREKSSFIRKFNADVYIIQECENPDLITYPNIEEWGYKYFWTGDNKNKGLGIFVRPDNDASLLNWEDKNLKHFLAISLNNNINILAAWCHGANLPTLSYIGQFWQYLQHNKGLFGNIIIAGDFNSNAIWDKRGRVWNHSEVVRDLKEIKIESLYHCLHNQIQGSEESPTFFLQKKINKPYHIDYIFCSDIFLNESNKIIIGNFEDWISLSDHMPLFSEITIRQLPS